ncbi:MAG: leucine-rich repeat domain-containing protein [Clostridia bacterium]|nr:leucine-rich repeat domain-containing protein [Clostridia bacterium]
MKTVLVRVAEILFSICIAAAVIFLLSASPGEAAKGMGSASADPPAPLTAGEQAVEVYGKRFLPDSAEIAFSGDEVDGFEGLLEKIGDFPSLKTVDFGSLSVSVDEIDSIRAMFGDIDLKIGVYVTVAGRKYDQASTLLDLSGTDPAVIPELTEKLNLFTDLGSVDLHGVEIAPEQQRDLAEKYPEVRFLWDVAILDEKYDSATEDLDLTNHRELTLDTVREFIPLFCDLKRLDLSDCGFANEDLAGLREEFPDTKIVWTLYMGKWSLKTDAVAFSVLIYNYNYTALRSPDIEVLKYCTDLQALDLGHQRLTDLSVIGDYLPELRILILADNTVSDLTPLSKLKHLHYLELFVNPYLTDVSPIGECKEMVDLNISHIYGLTDISALLDFPMLERLWIENTGVSAADIQLLKDTYPNANVTNIGWGSVDQGWRWHPRYNAMIDMYHKTDYISEEFSKYDSAD